MKILITGGHFSPAFSIVQELKKSWQIYIIGRKTTFEGDRGESFEYKVARNYSVPFYEIHAGRLQRKFTRHTPASLFRFPLGVVESYFLVRRLKPDLVLTFGGYIGLPVSVAAYLRHVPIVVHEQTQKAGMTNRLISRLAAKICISFQSSQQFFPENKTVLTGNPIRKEALEAGKAIDVPENGKIIYVTGGSGGSHFINMAISKIVDRLLDDFVLIHQTGNAIRFRDYDRLRALRSKLPAEKQKRYIIKKFVLPDEIGWIYKNSRLVISRSGINTILELLAWNKPCILIPVPYGQKGEQFENASIMKQLGLGAVLKQESLSSKMLLDTIYQMEQAAVKRIPESVKKKYIFPDSGQRIENVLQSVYEKKN